MPVSPMHYEHCASDVGHMDGDLQRLAREVVATAKRQGVSVWKALATARLPYDFKEHMAKVWAGAGRGTEKDRQEYFA